MTWYIVCIRADTEKMPFFCEFKKKDCPIILDTPIIVSHSIDLRAEVKSK